MWIPERFALATDEAYALLATLGAADLLTPTAEGISATFLPLLLDAGTGTLRGHLARQNPHVAALRANPDTESLVIAHGPDAYISPLWYPSKATNPRTVPTWDYTVVHVHGRVRLVDDQAWLLDHLRALSDHHERGVELTIDRVEGKAKQSQNKSPEDVAGVVAGLRSVGEDAAAAAVEHANGGKVWPPPRLKYR